MTSLPRAPRRVLSRVAVQGRALVVVLAGSSLFSWSCQGEVAQGPVDTANRADDGGVTTADGASNDGGLPACTWPASFDDAAPQQCSAARAYVACQDGDRCMSSDPTTCPGEPDASCTDVCNPNEYAVGCGGLGLFVSSIARWLPRRIFGEVAASSDAAHAASPAA